MERLRGACLMLAAFLGCALALYAQTTEPPAAQAQPAKPATPTASADSAPAHSAMAPPIPTNAPRISKQTRYEIIRDFETQIVYSRTAFPMGTKGLTLKDGETSPNGQELQQALAVFGPAVRPGDPSVISFVQIKENRIHFDLNGGAIRRKKWYQHIQLSGSSGAPVQMGPNESAQNPHGTYLDIYFDKYVPEMTAQQLRDLLYPVLDFSSRNKEEAYLETVPPKAKESIQAHHVLVGMNSEMVLHAKGKPPKKVREKDGDIPYEEWIYGEPPQDVDFIRIVSDEVVRVETMKVGGQKIVRTEKEVILPKPEDTEAKKDEDRPANSPSLRRPGEDQENAPKPSDTGSPLPPMPPPDIPQPPGSGPGAIIAGH